MSFGSNLTYLRKEKAITQERLAELMSVSRQTVSRWEGDSVLPDVDTLVRLCDVFGCDLDTLVRGDVAGERQAEVSEPINYDGILFNIRSLYKRLALLIAIGVFLIVGSVALLLFINSASSSEYSGVIAMLTVIAVGVGIIVYAGVSHEIKGKDLPTLPTDKYRRDGFFNLIPWFFAAATVIIILDILLLILLMPRYSTNQIEQRTFGTFMLVIAVAVFLFVYAGIRMSEEGYVMEKAAKTSTDNNSKRLLDAINSSVMLLATIIFLLLGLMWGLWHPGWVAFPIGGIVTGIISTIYNAITGKGSDED